MTPLDIATGYVRRNFSVVPVPHGSKAPLIGEWQHLRLKEEDLAQHFNCEPSNVGVLTGKPSRNLVDIDLDHPLAVELADKYLPPTPAQFGRLSKRRSHRLYYVRDGIKTRRFKSKQQGTIAEIRSTGAQTIFPGSTHPSGEPIEWEDSDAEPAEIDAETLIRAMEALVDAVKSRLKEQPHRKASRSLPPLREAAPITTLDQRIGACLHAMKQMQIEDANDGSHRLFAAACRCVEFDLDDKQSIACMRTYEQQHPFPRTWCDDELHQRLIDAEKRCERGRALIKASKVQIVIDTDEHRVCDDAVRALAADRDLYQRGGCLVRIVEDRDHDEANDQETCNRSITVVPDPNLRDRLTRFVEFVGYDKHGELKDRHPPAWLVSAIAARRFWPGIRHLSGISDAPILRPDGSVLQEPGYDQRTGVLYVPTREFPTIDENVDIDDAQIALEELLDVVCDFPFEAPEHKAAWLAALLTGLAHHAFSGPSPLFLIDANVRGAGKGLLAQIIGRTVLGYELPVFSYAPDPDEMRKKMTSIALAGDRMILLDNLEGAFGNDALDRALTSTRWKDRVLGGNAMIDLPLRVVWLATGNNVMVQADTIRRVIHIRLDVFEEQPEHRSHFKHADLLGHINVHRPQILAAALTILRAYCRAGRPQQSLQNFGSFEGWSRLVRQAVVWVGLPDPCLTRNRLVATADSTVDILRRVFTAWGSFDHAGEGFVLSKLLELLYSDQASLSPDDSGIALRSALEELAGCALGKPLEARGLAARLRTFRHRVVDGMYLEVDDSRRREGVRWVLRRWG